MSVRMTAASAPPASRAEDVRGSPTALASARYRWTVGLGLTALQSIAYFGIGHAHLTRSTELLRTHLDDAIPFLPWTAWCYLPFYAATFIMTIGGSICANGFAFARIRSSQMRCSVAFSTRLPRLAAISPSASRNGTRPTITAARRAVHCARNASRSHPSSGASDETPAGRVSDSVISVSNRSKRTARTIKKSSREVRQTIGLRFALPKKWAMLDCQ